jgi:Fe-S-cluster containining protein
MIYCNYCPGYCCYRLAGSVLLITATDINRLARHFGVADAEIRRRCMENRYTFKVKTDGSCLFLADDRLRRRCTVHEARPDQCRRFPYGRPCPYLEREELLAAITPRIESMLKLKPEDR